MASSVTVLQQQTGPDGLLAPATAATYTASSYTSVDESVPSPSTNLLVNIAITYASVSVLYILSDVAMTLKTNSSSAPDNTISLLANKPLLWTSDSYFANPLSANVTKVYLTQSSGATGTIKIRVLQDATP